MIWYACRDFWSLRPIYPTSLCVLDYVTSNTMVTFFALHQFILCLPPLKLIRRDISPNSPPHISVLVLEGVWGGGGKERESSSWENALSRPIILLGTCKIPSLLPPYLSTAFAKKLIHPEETYPFLSQLISTATHSSPFPSPQMITTSQIPSPLS